VSIPKSTFHHRLLNADLCEGERLIYGGMSGRGSRKRSGPNQSSDSPHVSGAMRPGRLSGDQFWVYVANRLVIPTLRQRDWPNSPTVNLLSTHSPASTSTNGSNISSRVWKPVLKPSPSNDGRGVGPSLV
jgi:hypothetical protein